MTILRITVGDREQHRENVLAFVQAVEAGEPVEGTDQATLQFGSYADFTESLTPLRFELIKAIAEHDPDSMREAARLVDRDVSDVHGDLKRLEVLDIITLEEGGPGGAMRPVVPYDQIDVDIAMPLVGDDASTDPAEV